MFKVNLFTNCEILFTTFSVGRQATKINPLEFNLDRLDRSLNLDAKMKVTTIIFQTKTLGEIAFLNMNY